MQRINEMYFDNICLLYKDEIYSIISISDMSIIERVFSDFKINPLVSSKNEIQLEFVIDDNFLKLESIILSKNIPIINEYLGTGPVEKDDEVFYMVNCYLKNLKVVFCKKKKKSKFKKYPFHLSYEYEVVKIFNGHVVYDVSNIINELVNLNLKKMLKKHSTSSVEGEFFNVAKKAPNDIDFEDILSFEDYYEYMNERKG